MKVRILPRSVVSRISCYAAGISLILGLSSSIAIAQDNEPVLSGEYVISSISPAAPVREKALDTLKEVTADPLAIIEGTSGAMLVADIRKNTINRTDHERPVRAIKSSLCKSVRKHIRNKRVSRRRTGGHTIIRNFVCDLNGIFTVSAQPNDPLYSNLWGFSQPNNIDINATEAWDGGFDCSNIVVAVIDTGVKYDHSDLTANMWRNPGEIPGNGVDDDGNGVIDDVYGYNATNDSGNPMDDNGHGTHVAGTIGARGNNGIGVSGVCQRVQIMALKFLTSTGSGSLWDAVKAIQYMNTMKRRGVNIVVTNNSWGGGGYYSTLYSLIADSRDLGIIFVAAAGNNSNNNDANPSYPASYGLDNIVSVAAVDSSGYLAYFSNYGASSVHIGAPGVSIVSTWFDGGYATLNGTSMAAPHISGILALMAARLPFLTTSQLRSELLQTRAVKYLPSLQGRTAIPGIPDLVQLVGDPTRYFPPGFTPAPTPTPTQTATPTPTPTPTASPTQTATPTPGYYAISGVVTDSQGNGIGGALVTLTLQDSSGTIVTTSTGSSGEYLFAGVLGPVNYSISIVKSGMQFNAANGRLLANVTHNFLAVPDAIQVSARVVKAEDGSPVAGVTVTNGSTTGTSDSSGLVTFSVPFGSTYSMKVDVPVGASYAAQDTVTGQAEGPVRRTFVLYY